MGLAFLWKACVLCDRCLGIKTPRPEMRPVIGADVDHQRVKLNQAGLLDGMPMYYDIR